MKSLKFPQIFDTNSTRTWYEDEYTEATKQNAIILLQCEQGELFGDPAFGPKLKAYLFDQNSVKLKDIIIDTIYTNLALFMPQIWIRRDSINIVQDREKGKLYCYFNGISQIDFKTNTYQLALFSA